MRCYQVQVWKIYMKDKGIEQFQAGSGLAITLFAKFPQQPSWQSLIVDELPDTQKLQNHL